jgi:hypothetical protein
MYCDGDTIGSICVFDGQGKCEHKGGVAGTVVCGLKSDATCVRDAQSATGAKCEKGAGTGATCKIPKCKNPVAAEDDVVGPE